MELTLEQEIKSNTWFNNLIKTKSILLKIAGSLFVDAPSDGEQYVRQDGEWTVVNTSSSGEGKRWVGAIYVQEGSVDDTEIYSSHSDLTGVTFSVNNMTLTISNPNSFTISGLTNIPKISFNIKRISDNNDETSADIWIQDLSGDETEALIVKYDGDPIAGYYIIDLTVF